jgi:hypothetical protein
MPDPKPATVADVERDHATCGELAQQYASWDELYASYDVVMDPDTTTTGDNPDGT